MRARSQRKTALATFARARECKSGARGRVRVGSVFCAYLDYTIGYGSSAPMNAMQIVHVRGGFQGTRDTHVKKTHICVRFRCAKCCVSQTPATRAERARSEGSHVMRDPAHVISEWRRWRRARAVHNSRRSARFVQTSTHKNTRKNARIEHFKNASLCGINTRCGRIS